MQFLLCQSAHVYTLPILYLYSTVQYSTVQYSTVQYSTVHGFQEMHTLPQCKLELLINHWQTQFSSGTKHKTRYFDGCTHVRSVSHEVESHSLRWGQEFMPLPPLHW
jgi:hypothetical protein